jgi:hypothetical protein
MRVFLQEKNILAHNKSPDGMIDRSIFVVALIDGELQQVFREGLHRSVGATEWLNAHASFDWLRPHAIIRQYPRPRERYVRELPVSATRRS